MPHPSVLAVLDYFPAPSETFIVRKLTGLRDAGVPVTVAAGRFAPGAHDQGLPLVTTNPWRPRPLIATKGRGAAGAARALIGSSVSSGGDARPSLRGRAHLAPLVSARADIVHFEFSGVGVGYLDVLDRLRPAKLVVSCRGAGEQIVPLSDPTRPPALRALFEQVDLIHCVSDDMRATVVDLGAPDDKILVNRPAIPVADFAPLAARRAPHDGPLRVLSVGRLHWKKGLDDGLRAVARVVASGRSVEYRIAGEGPEREKLSFLIHDLGLERQATLLGTQPQAEIRELLVWADVLLLPSLSEGISNAVLEAMAAGLPVVATSCGGMGEVIDDGIDGFLVPVAEPEAAAACLGRLVDDRALAAELGVAAARRAVGSFDVSRQIGNFVQAYDALTERGRASSAGQAAPRRP
ncbi:glycosyltransferase family 4 protein [Aquihabitans sp. McL0605]|uniref:glycosyltransferase family 4 protein n=1 Tax=Aquihabitans sp. McL0605 TaxID=3415671 RepID=UPI003CE99180